MTKFELIAPESGDWEAIYINDKLVAEGHRVRFEDILHALQHLLPNKFIYTEISDELAEEGFPKK